MAFKKAVEKPTSRKRLVAGIFLGVFFMSLVSFTFSARQVQAFPGEAMAAAVWSFAKSQASKAYDQAKQVAKEAYKTTKDVAFKNALRIYLTRIAEDTATYIATGGEGQEPLFWTNPGKYLVDDLGNAALGDYLDTLSTNTLGYSLCDVGPVKVKIDLALRAEISPNFCTDGCRKSYEQGLQTLKSHTVVLDQMKSNLASYTKSLGTTTCATLADEAACTGNTACQWCESATGLCATDQCITSTTRPLDYTERLGFPEYGGLEENVKAREQIVNDICLAHGADDLASCVSALSDYIQSEQQRFEFNRQRCVRVCEGRKRTAKCTYTDIRDNVRDTWNESDFAVTYPQIFNPKENEVGQYLFAYETAREEAKKETERKKLDFAYGDIGPLRDLISGSILTPKSLTKKAAEKPIEEAGKDTTTYTGSPLADAIGVFTETLTKKLIERIFNPKTGGFTTPSSGGFFGGGYNSGGIAAARAQFAKTFTPNVTRFTSSNLDLVSNLQNDQAIDNDFAEAVRQTLTVEEAVNKNLLHGDWWFGYNPAKQEPSIGDGGYPASVFPILRSNRILPVGWEIVAEYIKNNDVDAKTLADVLAAYDDPTSLLYRLIDPKWVLKAPLAICAKEGFGEKLVEGSCQSSEVVELKNNDNDACDTGEHDTNHDGKCNLEDPPIYENTCAREQVCIDPQTCVRESPDGKSCEEYGYCTKEKPIWRFPGTACDSQYASCVTYIAENGSEVSYLSDSLDRTGCSADTVGCQRYCYKDSATGEYTCNLNTGTQTYTGNLIHFDKDVERCANGDEGCTQLLRTTSGANLLPNASFEQSTSISPANNQADFAGWDIGGSNQSCGAQGFVNANGVHGVAAMQLQQLPSCGADTRQYASATAKTGRSLDGRTFTLSFVGRSENPPCNGSVTILAGSFTRNFALTYTESNQRFADTFSLPAGGGLGNDLTVRFNTIQDCPIIIDAAKVEESNLATDFRNYGDDATYLKLPPSNISCTGAATDSAECSKYALSCPASEVGCNQFTPAEGGVVIPGQVTDPSQCDFQNNPAACDQCPAAFVGCKALREVPLTAKIPNPSAPATSPRNANAMVSIVPATGRSCSAEYVGCEEYTNLDEVARGGEAREYYKQVQQCVTPSDPDLAYYFSWVGSDSTGFELKRWQLKQSDASNAPCTNLAVSADPNAACVDSSEPVTNCAAEFQTNPDCTQFYDELGGVHYRYLSEVIQASDSCKPYRNTFDSNTYYFDGSQSQTCPAQFAGCREYHGAATNNTRTLFIDDFESSVQPIPVEWLNVGTLSSDSTYAGGHSLPVSLVSSRNVVVKQNRSYIVTLWAKSTDVTDSALQVYFGGTPSPADYFTTGSPPVILNFSGEWTRYQFGPVDLTWAPAPTSLVMRGFNVLIDNVQLQETTDAIYQIKGSASQCNGFENCSAYTDISSKTHYLKGFSRLCQAKFAGCEALIDTHNSTTPDNITLSSEQMYPQGNGTYASSVPEDSVRFLVNDPKKSCNQDAKGCQALGQMSLAQDGTVSKHSTVFLKNDPDKFSSILCPGNAVACGKYEVADEPGAISYFKDPGLQTCEYKENIGPARDSGWFKKGTTEACPDSWVKNCPSDQSSCREFSAPAVYSNSAAPGTDSYFYLGNTLDKNLCPQGIDTVNGCYGFYDESAGLATTRTRIDSTSQSAVQAASCQKCSADTTTCGRNGNAPCCKWDGASCSFEKAQGLDDVAPHYCVLNFAESDYEICVDDINAGYAVPDTVSIPNATNCGRAGQPKCFDLFNSNPGIPASTPDPSDDYAADKRYCGDYACNANIVLKVSPDRMCDQWLACTSEQTVIRGGVPTKICLERALRDADGFVQNGGDNSQENLVKDLTILPTPDNIGDIANYSGLTKAGVRFTASSLVDGLFPYGQMYEDGLDGAIITVPNSTFEEYKISLSESPLGVYTSPPGGKSWINAENFDWKATKSSGIDETFLSIEKTDDAGKFSNQFLSITSLREGGADAVGAYVNVLTADVLNNTGSYYATFTARQVHANNLTVNVHLDQGPVQLYSNTVTLTPDWQTYEIQLNRVGSLTAKPSSDIRLYFDIVTPVQGGTLQIDNVQLKPTLIIKTDIAGDRIGSPRVCRSYPQSSSVTCDYMDSQSQVNYQGFKGYCVEEDPRNPDVCLNWWPIDALEGEVNVFDEASTSQTRAPLYYCAEGYAGSQGVRLAPGADPITTFTNQFVLDEQSANAKMSWGSICEPGRFDFAADYTTNALLSGKQFSNRVPMATGALDLATPNTNGCEVVSILDPRHIANTCQMSSTISGLGYTNWKGFAGSRCRSGVVPDFNNSDIIAADQDRYTKEEIQTINFVMNRWSHEDWIFGTKKTLDGPSIFQLSNQSTCTISVGAGETCWSGSWSNNGRTNETGSVISGGRIDIHVIFNSAGRVDRYRVYMADYAGGGGAWVIGLFHLNNYCKTLVQVTQANGESQPYSNRVASGAYSTAAFVSNPMPFNLGTSCGPWGAAPVIQGPQDILNCVPDPLDPPQNGCTVTNGQCQKVVDSDGGLCVNGALEIYNAQNPNNNNRALVCSETRKAGAMYGCLSGQGCRVCQGGSSHGLICTTDSDCPGTGAACVRQFDYDAGMTQSINKLKQLFARSYGFWRWNATTRVYEKTTTTANWAPPTTLCPAGVNHTNNTMAQYCAIRPQVTEITVNEQLSSDVYVNQTNRAVQTKFTYQIDPEQTPLAFVTIDWGDGNPKSTYRSGVVEKVYHCDSNDGVNCFTCEGTGVRTSIIDPTDGVGKYACVYTGYPRIQVHDNWGWCSVAAGVTSTDECTSDSSTWASYTGRIIVVP